MANPPATPAADSDPGSRPGPDELRDRRWTLIRDLVVFAAKAVLEALRDLVLIPIAFVVGIGGLLLRRGQPERPFHDMLRVGRRFDDWLNLFGPIASEKGGRRRPRGETVDAFFARLEAIVVEQHRRGGITTSAKTAIDRGLDRLQGGSASERPEDTPPRIGEPR